MEAVRRARERQRLQELLDSGMDESAAKVVLEFDHTVTSSTDSKPQVAVSLSPSPGSNPELGSAEHYNAFSFDPIDGAGRDPDGPLPPELPVAAPVYVTQSQVPEANRLAEAERLLQERKDAERMAFEKMQAERELTAKQTAAKILEQERQRSALEDQQRRQAQLAEEEAFRLRQQREQAVRKAKERQLAEQAEFTGATTSERVLTESNDPPLVSLDEVDSSSTTNVTHRRNSKDAPANRDAEEPASLPHVGATPTPDTPLLATRARGFCPCIIV